MKRHVTDAYRPVTLIGHDLRIHLDRIYYWSCHRFVRPERRSWTNNLAVGNSCIATTSPSPTGAGTQGGGSRTEMSLAHGDETANVIGYHALEETALGATKAVASDSFEAWQFRRGKIIHQSIISFGLVAAALDTVFYAFSGVYPWLAIGSVLLAAREMADRCIEDHERAAALFHALAVAIMLVANFGSIFRILGPMPDEEPPTNEDGSI